MATAALEQFGGTAVFLGGTAGIGRALALRIAEQTNARCRIVLVGRNKAAAEDAFDHMRKRQRAEHEYSFEPCDATSFSNVRETARRLRESLDRVDLLVLTCGFLSFKGRVENNEVERTDTKMACNYYSRMLMIRELLPLLQQARERDGGGDARVMSVLDSVWAPGELDYSDLELKKTFGLSKCAKHTTTMTNVTFEDFALRHPGISFIHAYPGFVRTSVGSRYPFPLNWVARAATCVAVSPDTCAERLAKPLFEERYAAGSFRVDAHGEPVDKPSPESGEEARRRVGEHLEEVLGRGC